MEKAPEFLKDYTKETAQSERDALAQEIRNKRNEYFDRKSKEQIERDERIEKLKNLSAEIERLSETGVSKVLNYAARRIYPSPQAFSGANRQPCDKAGNQGSFQHG